MVDAGVQWPDFPIFDAGVQWPDFPMPDAEVQWSDFQRGRERFASVPEIPAFGPQARPPHGLADWVAKHRVIVGGPSPGPWRHVNAPAALEPMRAFSARGVEQVTVMTPTQLFKSELAVNAVVYSVALGRDTLFFEPDLPLLRRFMADRIRPALLAVSPEVQASGLDAGLLKRKDSTVELRLPGGGSVIGLTPAQKTGKTSHTAQVVVIDEIEAMGAPDLMLVARARTTTYGRDASVLAVSVPGEDAAGSIWRLWSSGSRGEFRGRCPHCSEHVSLRWGRVDFERDADGWWLPEWDGGEAALVCERCEARWSNEDRLAAVAAGRYVHAEPGHAHQTFWVPGPAHLWRTVPRIVEEGREAYRAAVEDGDWPLYQRFINEFAGEVWDPDVQGLSGTKLVRTGYSLGPRGEEDLGALDPRARLITVGADVGGNAVFAEWVAWGVEEDPLRVLAWGLRYQQFGGGDADIEDGALFEAFEKAIDTWGWRVPGGERRGCMRGLVDIGYRPEVVHAWLKQRYVDQARRVGSKALPPYGAMLLPYLGKRSPQSAEYPVDLRMGVASKDKRRRVPAPVWCDSGALKETVYDTLAVDQRLPEASRAWRWPDAPEAEGYGPAYRTRLTSEVKVRRRTPRGAIEVRWEMKKGVAGENEPLDCRVMAYAAALAHCAAPRRLPLAEGLLALPLLTGPPGGNVVPLRPG